MSEVGDAREAPFTPLGTTAEDDAVVPPKVVGNTPRETKTTLPKKTSQETNPPTRSKEELPFFERLVKKTTSDLTDEIVKAT